jgi:hypothetical protein
LRNRNSFSGALLAGRLTLTCQESWKLWPSNSSPSLSGAPMPKRVLDGEAIYGSDKLAGVALEYKAEYANLIPLALANGSFEASPRRVWSKVYAYNRPEVTLEHVEKILAELERVKLLFRWADSTGKQWGYWVGIDKKGRLPSQSRLNKKHEALGAVPPADLLQTFMESNGQPMVSHHVANGQVGFGSCSGSGSGINPLSEGKAPSDCAPVLAAPVPKPVDPVTDEIVDQIRLAHPRGNQDKADGRKAIRKAIDREAAKHGGKLEAARYLYTRTATYAAKVKTWPKDEFNFGKMCATWFNKESYGNPDESFDRPGAKVNGVAAVVRPMVDAKVLRQQREMAQ